MFEICNNQSRTFADQRRFLSQFNFRLHLACDVFNSFLLVKGLGMTMVNNGKRVQAVNIVLFTSKSPLLSQHKVWQCIKLARTFLSFTLKEGKTHFLNYQTSLPVILHF